VALEEIPQDPRDSCGYGQRSKVVDLETFGRRAYSSGKNYNAQRTLARHEAPQLYDPRLSQLT